MSNDSFFKVLLKLPLRYGVQEDYIKHSFGEFSIRVTLDLKEFHLGKSMHSQKFKKKKRVIRIEDIMVVPLIRESNIVAFWVQYIENVERSEGIFSYSLKSTTHWIISKTKECKLDYLLEFINNQELGVSLKRNFPIIYNRELYEYILALYNKFKK